MDDSDKEGSFREDMSNYVEGLINILKDMGFLLATVSIFITFLILILSPIILSVQFSTAIFLLIYIAYIFLWPIWNLLHRLWRFLIKCQ